MARLVLSVVCILIMTGITFAQDPDSLLKVTPKYLQSISGRADQLSEKMDKYSRKALSKYKEQEERIIRKLSRIDSAAAAELRDKLSTLKQNFENAQAKATNYIPFLDTITTSFKFLEQQQFTSLKEPLEQANASLKQLESGLSRSENIKQFLKEHQQLLKKQLEKFGFASELKQINKEVYYYSQQLNEYKAILKDPKKIERKAIELLTKSKPFRDFMRKNSLLASLFRMPSDDPNDPAYIASLAGLQTRNQVQQLIQDQLSIAGPDARNQVNQNIQAAQSQLQQLKDKMERYGGSSGDIMPEGFKPNHQKSKPFLKRIEIGTNIQTSKGSNFFPVTTDLGLSLGYKLNDKSIIGVGASYKLGLGTGWRNIALTHQGVGLRSFVDWKLKGSFWISGGFEQNYRNEIRNIAQLNDRSAWQQSGLIGLSKVISTKSRFFKKTKLQVLWDFLSYEQVPRSQPVIFRFGYGIN